MRNQADSEVEKITETEVKNEEEYWVISYGKCSWEFLLYSFLTHKQIDKGGYSDQIGDDSNYNENPEGSYSY